MELQTLAMFGEFVGGLGVVLSLLYVAIQLKHNAKSQRAASYGHTLDRMASMQQRLSSDGELTALYNRGLVSPQALSLDDRVRFTWVLTELFGAMEFMHQQYEEGHLPDQIWRRWSKTLAWWLSFPGVQLWWRSKPTPFTPDFSALIELKLAAAYRQNPEWERYLYQ